MKRAALAAAVALTAGALAGSAGAASTGSSVHLTEAKGPPFPVKTYVLSVQPQQSLGTADVHVTENGGSVLDPSVIPASKASKETFGVVLLSDNSFSMAGAPLAAALAAEQAFVAQQNPNEQVGLIDFDRKATVVQPLTTSQQKLQAKLAETPSVAGGTHIYDAVAAAEEMLKAAHISSGSIVVLSDGADTGSKETIDQVANSAKSANVRIYTIGLNDASYSPGTLKSLAAAGNGQYAQATAGALGPLFAQLGQQLSNEYLLQYKSLTKLGQPVHVKVNVGGLGTATAAYHTPPVPATAPGAKTYSPSIGSRIWGSALTLVLLVLLVAGVVALLVWAILQPRSSGLPARMAEFVSIRDLQRENKGISGPTPTSDPSAPAQLAPEPKSAWTRFEDMLEIAEITIDPELIVVGTILATVLAFFLILAITGSFWWALFAFGVPYLVREWILRTLARRRNKFAEQLPDALQVVASALRSGHSFAGALAVVVDSGSEPMKSELQRVVADEQLGVPIQNSLGVVAERMASTDVEQLALVAELQREAGGNAAEVIDRVAETVRERFDLRRLIKTLTTQGRMSRLIVSLLPVFIILVLQIENPHYLHPLTSSTGGQIVLGLAAAWAIAGSLVIKRIVEIEV